VVRHALPVLILASALLLGCGRDDRDNRAFTAADPWFRAPSTELIVAEGWKRLAKDDFAVVSAKGAMALAKLKDSPWRELSQGEAEELLGRPLAGAGGHLVLLRALSLNEPTGGFDVMWYKGAVRVHHGCLGRHPVPMTRRALVARLPELPSEVYVDCSMAE
jgi:hypothetical protein